VKLTLPVDQLAALTATASRSLPARPPVPVLAGLLLDATEDGDLILAAFDYEVSARVTDPSVNRITGQGCVTSH
jgi:DNA polymerase-3 subunit beta